MTYPTTQSNYSSSSGITSRDYLSREQETALFQVYKEGTEQESIKARDKLFRSLHNFVCKFAAKYVRRCNHLQYEDCMQMGFLGLVKAIEKFDPDKGVRLSTYAAYWITQQINREIDDKDSVIRVPCHVAEKCRQYTKTENSLTAELGRQPTEEEVYQATGMGAGLRKGVERAEKVVTVSLETPVGKGDDNVQTLQDTLVDENCREPDSEADEMIMHESIASALSRLTPVQRYVIAQRFGLNASQEPKTLEVIGETVKLSRERIRQIEAVALKRFRKMADVMRQLEPLRASYN